jgi:hypothetical protein
MKVKFNGIKIEKNKYVILLGKILEKKNCEKLI